MDNDASAGLTSLIDAGRRALARFEAAGYRRCEPAALQPTAAFVDLVGEELKTRLLLTGDSGEFCLRPEFTIPVCMDFLAGRLDAPLAQVCYFGSVFRVSPEGPTESRQVGLESLGRGDLEATDAEILGLALEAAQLSGRGALKVHLGDAQLLNDVLRLLGVQPRLSRRIRRGVAGGHALSDVLPTARVGEPDHGGVLAALSKTDHDGAKSLVRDLLAISGIKPLGGRSIDEISERLLAKSEQGAAEDLGPERRAALETFLAIRGDPDACVADLRDFAKRARLALAPAIERLESRIGFIAARGMDVGKMDFATSFLRLYDYYSGFLFDAVEPRAPAVAVVGGGRYDALARSLGANADVPAVGAALWIGDPPDLGSAK